MSRRSTLLAAIAMSATLQTSACAQQGMDEPEQALVTAGECEGDAYAKSMDTGGVEPMEIWAEADAAGIMLHLDNLAANCCPSPGAQVNVEGFEIVVAFDDVTAADECGCMCITDFTVEIGANQPGEYTIDVDYDGAYLGSTTVELP